MAKNKGSSGSGDPQLDYLAQGTETFFRGVFSGCRELVHDQGKMIVFVLTTLACGVVFYLRHEIAAWFDVPKDLYVVPVALTLVIFVPIIMLYLIGVGKTENPDEFEKKFAEIGFCGKGKIYPKFIKKEEKGVQVIYHFSSPGLDLNDWRQQQTKLETVLDCNIVKTEHAKNTKRTIILHTVPASKSLETDVLWTNEMIREKDFEITVGRGMLDDISFDLNKVPHALIAGVTGSGKSVLLRCILWQCIKKGAKIYMIDFKGGVEFGKQYEQFGDVITDRQEALEVLKDLTQENALRLQLFRSVGVKNIVEYNAMHPNHHLCRIILFCDEIAEMLDKTGLSNADKAIFYEIEKEMSTLARLARAPGINMMLATQRPDAKVLVGQIKNNLPIRISGRMVDSQASEMVLGNTKASLLGDTLGRFLYTIGSDTYEFQAYNFSDSAVIGRQNYQVGRMLLEQNDEEEDLHQEKSVSEIETYKLAEITYQDEFDEDIFEGF